MTPRLPLRPVLASLAAVSLSACGMAESRAPSFEAMAENVAAIPLDGQAPGPSSRERGLRPALEVEVLTPHDLWDAREGRTPVAAADPAEKLVEAAAPVVAGAVVEKVAQEVRSAGEAALRPALHREEPVEAPVRTRGASLVQLGAYGSEASARAAWGRLKSGPAAWALEGLEPTYETAQVNGRSVVRLKTRAPGAGAAALCAAAGIDDPWCHRAGG